MQFPIRKGQIIEHAKSQKASSDVIEGLQMIPDKEYESADSLIREMESPSQTASDDGGGKSQSFGETGTVGPRGGRSSIEGSIQSFGGI